MTDMIAGKYRALRSLLQFMFRLKNWRVVWAAYRASAPMPSFDIRRSNLRLFSDPESDDVVILWREIFCEESYTRDFYNPRTGDTVIDLGANIGTFALFLEHIAPGIRVHCFEPAADTRARLAKNIEANHLDGFVSIYPFAIGGAPGILQLAAARIAAQRSVHASHFTLPPDSAKPEEVECITLTDVMRLTNASRVDLLKIDIEGAEVDVLESVAPEVLKPVKRIALEYHDEILPESRVRCENALRRLGFDNIILPAARPPFPILGLLRASRRDISST